MLFDGHAHAVDGVQSQIEYETHTTPDGGVQDDADVMFDRACRALDDLLARAGAQASHIAAVASDQMVSNVLGVNDAGRAVTPVYTYADTRSARQVDQLRAQLDAEMVHQRVGTLFHTSYLPARFLWLASTNPDLFRRVRGWMSLGEYFYFRWLGRRACSYSTASWTGLLNRRALEWDRDLIAALPISPEQLSPLVDVYTPLRGLKDEYAARWPALRNANWYPTAGDGATANIGSGCTDATRVALTVGTSSAVRVTVPTASVENAEMSVIPGGLWAYRVDRRHELFGGALSEGGNLYEWTRETLKLTGDPAAIESELAAMPPDAHGLTVLPFLAGERAPGWVADARAAILGLSLNTRPIDILRAGLEGVAYRLALILDLLRTVAPGATQVIASGGALMHSPTWVQIIADVIGVPVITSAEPEATSRGAALLALNALGVTSSFKDLAPDLGVVYQPDAARHAIYSAAVKRQQKWYNLIVPRMTG